MTGEAHTLGSVNMREACFESVFDVFVDILIFVHTSGAEGNGGYSVPVTKGDVGEGHVVWERIMNDGGM